MLRPPPRLSQLPHTPAVRPRRPLGSRAPATAVPSHPTAAARGARGQPERSPVPAPVTSGGTRPGSAQRSGGGSRQAERQWGEQGQRLHPCGPARPSPARLVSPRALLTGAAGEQQQHPQSARDAAEEPHGRGETAGPGRARSARCRARGGPGRGRRRGPAGDGRGAVGSALSLLPACSGGLGGETLRYP